MIKVGFIGAVSKEWMGGLNYYKNLLLALNDAEDKKLEIFVFVGRKTNDEIKNMFSSYAKIIENSLFDEGSLKWYLAKIEQYFFKTGFIYAIFFKKYGIQILSHTSLVNVQHTKTINWIPDFQHVHLPETFSRQEINHRNNKFKRLINNSDLIVLSSNDALKDLKKVAVGYCSKWTSKSDKIIFLFTLLHSSTVELHPSNKDGFMTAFEYLINAKTS